MRSRDALSHDCRLLMCALWQNRIRPSTKKEKKSDVEFFFFYQALWDVKISYRWRLLVSVPYTKWPLIDFKCRFFVLQAEEHHRVIPEIPPGWYLGGIWVVSREFPKTLATIEESSIGWYGWYLVRKILFPTHSPIQ